MRVELLYALRNFDTNPKWRALLRVVEKKTLKEHLDAREGGDSELEKTVGLGAS